MIADSEKKVSTLDQERAQYAWQCASLKGMVKGYREMAKGAPALIMGNGLMSALAYYHSRTGNNKEVAHLLLINILGWLSARKMVPKDDFSAAMGVFLEADSQKIMQVTEETLAMLKWLRQFADALSNPDAGQSA